MNGSIKRTDFEPIENNLISENCNFSVYSMITAAGGILLSLGIVIYSFLAI